MTSQPVALPPFYHDKHVSYIKNLSEKLSTSFEGAHTEHLRMSGVYWSIAALSIILPPTEVDEIMKLKTDIVDFVFECYDKRTGGFAGNSGGQDAHILYTLSAIQILAIADALDDERLDRIAIGTFIKQLQQQDGSFVGDLNVGEIDTRFTYCGLSCVTLLKIRHVVDMEAASNFILKCRNEFDGGFGCVPGAESHAGQIFTCIGALQIAGFLNNNCSMSEADVDLLGWWLSERQCDSGGLNGRPEKQADVCYSWWIISAMSVLDMAFSANNTPTILKWINGQKLISFILQAQDPDDGGIADRPDDAVDVYHTFFGLCGLSLLGYFDDNEEYKYTHRPIDPTYALPKDIVEKLQL